MSNFKYYRKKTVQKMRPYIEGEDMKSISVGYGVTPELGGMIAVNEDDPDDKWYVPKDFFESHYVIAT